MKKQTGEDIMRAPDQSARASGILREHWREGRKLAALPPDLRPRDRIEGYAIQAEIETQSDQPLFGWKIAATSEAGQRHINVAGPMAGRILAETVLPVGSTAAMAGNAMRVAEPEFAFRLGENLLPRPTPYDVGEVLAAVETLHPAIEIPDSRFADFVGAGEAQLIADNACAHLFVLGAPATADWRSRDLIEERPRIRLRGETFVTRKITRAAAAIRLGKQEKLYVGNIDAKRDWGHAREYVRGMWMMLQQDEPDDYVLATGVTTRVRDFVTWAFEDVGINLEWKGTGVDEKGYDILSGRCIVEIDPRYFRPTEVELLIGDPTKAHEKLGWSHETSVRDLCREMVNEDLKVMQTATVMKEA